MGKDSKSADKRQYSIVALSIALIILTIVPSVSAATNIGVTSQGSTIYPGAKTVTAGGSVSIGTANYKFGVGSATFSGTNGQYLRINNAASFNFGSGSFTIEMWVRIPSNSTSQDLYTKRVDSTKQVSVTLLITGNAQLQLVASNSSANKWEINKAATSVIPLNTWTHVALVRNGDTWTVYQNGVSVITVTNSGSLSDDGAYPMIGGASDKWPFNGQIDEVRISNIARYTTNFTPQTSRFDHDDNTLVLMHLDGASGSTTFIDDVITGQAAATKISISSDNTPVSSISFYSHASGNFRVAIYSDNSGPYTKLWESTNTAAVTGWNTITTAAGTPSSLTLNTGTYWLVWQWNSANNGPSYTGGVNGDGKYLPMAYGSFPATWTGGTTSSHKWSIYITTGLLSVAPENNFGAVIAVAACLGASAVFVGYKRKAKN